MRRAAACWAAVHLAFPAPAGRLPLLCLGLGAADPLPGRAWYFVDLPAADEASASIEVGFAREAVEPLLPPAVEAWAHALLRAGWAVAARPVAAPALLAPALFPGGRPPAAYPLLLARGSHRALALLGALAARGLSAAPEALVAAELAATYRALIPRRAARAAALRWHATWLDAVAPAGAVPAPLAPAGAVLDDATGWTAVADATAALEDAALRRGLARAAVRAARAMAADEGCDAATARAALVARLAHVQVVRLWGPDAPAALAREAALARALAAREAPRGTEALASPADGQIVAGRAAAGPRRGSAVKAT